MQTLNQDIEDRTFKPVYLLFGEETFLKKSYEGRLRGTLTGEDTMSYNYFEGREMNVDEITGLADTMSFFTEKRLILMEDSGFFKSGVGADKLTEYMGEIPESTCLIFVESEIDKRNRLYKTAGKYGYTAKLSHQEPAQLTRWTTDILSKNGRRITDRAIKFFLNKAGDGMENINSELEKLVSYTLGHEVIIDEDVETICATQVANKIFDVITAIVTWQARKVMDLYEDLLTLREPPICILFLMARQFNQILQVKDLMGKGMDKSTIASRLKLQSFAAGRIMLQAKIFTREQALSYVDLCVDAEGGVEAEKLQGRLTMELLITNKYE